MSPIDDELRSALHGRAGDLPSTSFDMSPDFFAGVERRAKRIRRNKVAASVAGSALAVAAVAVAVPMLSSSTTSMQPAPPATAPPSEAPRPESGPFALDPADPWEYRGDPIESLVSTVRTVGREWAVRHNSESSSLAPLYGEVYEPSGQTVIVFVATDAQGDSWWGVAESTESGPEFLLDQPLQDGTTALPAALPGDEVARLLVVASPQVGQIEYAPDGVSFQPMSPTVSDEPGVAVTPLEGDPASDRIRVLDGDGDLDDPVFEGPAPDAPGASSVPPGEGPGTDSSPDVDTAAYRLDVSDPWAYRGPEELTQHPNLAAEDARLFAESGEGRGDGSWSERPLVAVELADGLSVLVVLHTKDDAAVVTTTSQRQDEAPVQSELEVIDGRLLLQAFVPDSDGSGGVLLAVASPRASAVETDMPRATALGGPAGVALWDLPPEADAGSIFVYGEGAGLLYHSEPARRS